MSSRQESDFARLEQLLREADERAELERKRADDEQRNRKEADERAELERQRAEDERATLSLCFDTERLQQLSKLGPNVK